jgi:PIN domain nuclease of toxin-antitoxin system
MTPDAVLDSTAVLAYLFDEPGAAMVERLATRAAMTGIAYAEVADRLVRAGMPAPEAARELDALGLDVAPFDRALAADAAALQPLMRYFKLSLGARATLALAKRLAVPAYTADATWTLPKIDVDIRVIR